MKNSLSLVVPDFPEETVATFKSHTSHTCKWKQNQLQSPTPCSRDTRTVRCGISFPMLIQQQWGDGNLPIPKQVATARRSCHPLMPHFFQKLSQLSESNVHRLNTANATSATRPILLTPPLPKMCHLLSVETAPRH